MVSLLLLIKQRETWTCLGKEWQDVLMVNKKKNLVVSFLTKDNSSRKAGDGSISEPGSSQVQ